MYARQFGLAIHGKDMYLGGGRRASDHRLRTSDCSAAALEWGGRSLSIAFESHFGLGFCGRRVGYKEIQVQVKGIRLPLRYPNVCAWQLSRRDQLAAQTDFRQVHPVVLLLFPHENQFAYLNIATAFEMVPARAGHLMRLLRLRLGAHLHNG